MKYPIVYLILLMFLYGCETRNNCKARLIDAEQLMFVRPDSSLIILKSLEDSIRFMPENDRALYALLMSQAKARNYIKVKDDSMIRVAIEYYAKSHDSRHLAWSYVYACDISRNNGNDSLAMAFIHSASKIAESADDMLLNYYVEYFLGNILKNSVPYENCIPHLSQALKYAKMMSDTARIATCLNEIGSAYVNLGKCEEARENLTEALKHAQSTNQRSKKSALNKKIALSYYAEHKYDDALHYINRAIADIPSIKHYGDSSSLYSLKGSILLKLNRLDSAEIYIHKGYNEEMPALIALYERGMAMLNEKRGNYQNAICHLYKYSDFKDSIADVRLKEKVTELEKKFNMAELIIAKRDSDIRLQRAIIALCVTIILAAMGAFVVLGIINKNKRAILELKNARDSLVMETIDSVWCRANKLIDNQRMRVETLTNYILDMDDVIVKIKSIKNSKNDHIAKSIDKMTLTDEEIKHLIYIVNKYYDDFIVDLKNKYPSLTDEDIAICCLIKLGIKNRDICLLLGISDSSLRKRKQRIRSNKLHIESSLDEWIINKDYPEEEEA